MAPLELMGVKRGVCVREQPPNWCEQKRRLFWERPSSSAPLPTHSKLLLVLGSFKLIILGRVLGLGFIIFKKGDWKRKKKSYLFYFGGISSFNAWFSFIFLCYESGAVSCGDRCFTPGRTEEGLFPSRV